MLRVRECGFRVSGSGGDFRGARVACRGPWDRPWREGGVAGVLMRAALGVFENDWAP